MRFSRPSLVSALSAASTIMLMVWSFLAASVSGAVLAPMREPRNPERVIPGRYLVRLRTPPENEHGSVLAVSAMHQEWLNEVMGGLSADSGKVLHVYDLPQMSGYSGDFTDAMLDEIRRRPEVEYVEPDQVVHVSDEQFLADLPESILNWRDYLGLNPNGRKQPRAVTVERSRRRRFQMKPQSEDNGKRKERITKVQRDAPWGLERLSNKVMPLTEGSYKYPESAGSGVDVYVIDTGINIRHKDFEGRAVWGKTIPLFDEDIDGNGHGTHCAGTIAGKTFGVAKKAKVHAVKVLMTSGFGTNSDVIKGVEWVIKKHYRRSRQGRRSVANMSLGGGKSEMLNEVVNMAVRSGVHFAVAAGNDNEDACDYSPASATGPVTVGAVDIEDTMAYFSNYGPCVDVFAPGVNITSAWIGSRYAKNTISGTSMASPHVAGVLALYLGERDYTPKQLKKMLIKHARNEVIRDIPEGTNTVNRLVCIDQLI